VAQIGDSAGGTQGNDQESIEAIHRAMDLGITLDWIQPRRTGLAIQKEVVARAIAGKRDKVIIATKCSLVWQEGDFDVRSCLKSDSIRTRAECKPEAAKIGRNRPIPDPQANS